MFKLYKNNCFMTGLLISFLVLVQVSCKKLIEATPAGTIISTAAAYSNETNIEASANGMYFQLQQAGGLYSGVFNGAYPLLGDEASIGSSTNNNYIQLSTNALAADNNTVSGMWNNNYSVIYQANAMIDNIQANDAINSVKKNQWLGEAHFLRAYCYLMLTTYFGKVALATTSDYRINATLPRADTAVVNKFILSEGELAESLLPDGYAVYNNTKVRATKQAAQALLARVYLYRGYYNKAEAKASSLINNNIFNLPALFTDVLKSNSAESIWEIYFANVNSSQNYTANAFLVPATPTTTLTAVIPSAKLVQAFETGDARKAAYLATSVTPMPGFTYLNKFRGRTTYDDQPKIFRLSEMYLIRAEARLQQNNLTGATADINVIRRRAGLANTTAITSANILAAIMQERFVELCFEGHRWPDLIRTGQADAALGAWKPNTWKTTAKLLPVPAVELGNNANLAPQNPGY